MPIQAACLHWLSATSSVSPLRVPSRQEQFSPLGRFQDITLQLAAVDHHQSEAAAHWKPPSFLQRFHCLLVLQPLRPLLSMDSLFCVCVSDSVACLFVCVCVPACKLPAQPASVECVCPSGGAAARRQSFSFWMDLVENGNLPSWQGDGFKGAVHSM